MNKICKADMVFWREAVVYYRSLRKALRITGDQKKAEETRQVLKESRMWQRFVEKAVLGIILLACLFIASGCIENTMRGAGKTVQGLGQFVSGIGKDVVRGTDGYSKEK